MNETLPFFNWSLRKVLNTKGDSFLKARLPIIYTILLFSLLKSFIVIFVGILNEQWLQVTRASVAFILYVTLVKILLYKPSSLKTLAHIMLLAGIIIIWTNIFVYTNKINLPTIQFAFMVVLSSFYTLGSGISFTYSFFAILPIVFLLITQGNTDIYSTTVPQELASPGFEIIVILNFISITVSHYLFYRAFQVNIKEKETLNEQLQVSIAEANKLAASKSNFLSTMSHELRTPLNSVVGVTELLLQDNPKEHQKENLKILQFSTLDLLSLINNVLDFNKTDADKQALEEIPFNLAEFIYNRCAGLKIKAHDKQIDFNIEIDEQLTKINVVSDPTRLSQVIYNLVSNAIKFTDKGNITVKLDCINQTDNNIEILFSVADTGIGISADKHNTIFELFTQAESHITRTYGGTGLGLAIVKQVLTLFNSDIHLESIPGNGSKFYFSLTFKTSENTSADKKSKEISKEIDLRNLKILIAEDNDVNRLLMKKQLDTLGIEPTIVENGKLAYEAYLAGNYDTILMDLHMPVQDGYETTQKIRSLTDTSKAKVHIIAFTASVTEQQKIIDNGFDDYLYKPVNMKDLRDKLEKIALYKEAVLTH